MQHTYSIYPLGDSAAVFQLGDTINITHHQQLLALQDWFQKQTYPFIIDIITAYHTLTVFYDALAAKFFFGTAEVYRAVAALIASGYDQLQPVEFSPITVKQIPVCYEMPYAVDLEAVAASKGITSQEVIALHTHNIYRVYLLGFLPGFPYLGILPEALHTSRKKSPSLSVAAGSVAIAGQQTGIYPYDSPGGWNIIGKTPINLFDTGKDPPCWLLPGDQVQFFAIGRNDFHQSFT